MRVSRRLFIGTTIAPSAQLTPGAAPTEFTLIRRGELGTVSLYSSAVGPWRKSLKLANGIERLDACCPLSGAMCFGIEGRDWIGRKSLKSYRIVSPLLDDVLTMSILGQHTILGMMIDDGDLTLCVTKYVTDSREQDVVIVSSHSLASLEATPINIHEQAVAGRFSSSLSCSLSTNRQCLIADRLAKRSFLFDLKPHASMARPVPLFLDCVASVSPRGNWFAWHTERTGLEIRDRDMRIAATESDTLEEAIWLGVEESIVLFKPRVQSLFNPAIASLREPKSNLEKGRIAVTAIVGARGYLAVREVAALIELRLKKLKMLA
jgi:hypothetical protein